MEKFSKFLNYINQRHGIQNTFNDFLTLSVCALSAQTQEDLYFEVSKKYTQNEMQYFANAFSSLVLEMDNNGEGLKDCLGGYFEEFCSSDTAGQFFTPECICDIMAQITQPQKMETVSDCCCGSGRNLLSAAKINRNCIFYGADICLQCVQMTLINMCLNGMFGVVEWMDSLRLEKWAEYRVCLHKEFNFPYIEKISLTEKIEVNEKEEAIKPILKSSYKHYKSMSKQLELL